jgi:hypothetical protein
LEQDFNQFRKVNNKAINELEAQVESMTNRLCNCRATSPRLVGHGMGEDPYELEYETDREYVTPPVATPIENVVPIPVPVLALEQSPLPASDQENIPPCCAGSSLESHVLVPMIEDIPEVDKMEEEAAEGRRTRMFDLMKEKTVVCQMCKKSASFKNSYHPYRLLAGQGRRVPRWYHLGVHHEFRRKGRGIEHGLGGYESSSESGSKGLSVSGL